MCLDYWIPNPERTTQDESSNNTHDDEHERNNLCFWINEMQLRVEVFLWALLPFNLYFLFHFFFRVSDWDRKRQCQTLK